MKSQANGPPRNDHDHLIACSSHFLVDQPSSSVKTRPDRYVDTSPQPTSLVTATARPDGPARP